MNKKTIKKTKSTFVFKYDKKNNLVNYLERDSSFKILSYYSYNHKNNSLLKYDYVSRLRILSQFEEQCKLVHRFEGGESWIRAVSTSDSALNLSYPKIKKQFALNSENQIVRFSAPQQLLSQWK